MNLIQTRNVHRALPLALQILHDAGETRQSRNGPVKVMNGPVTTLYDRPCERVMFWPQRDANPFFHFFESLWMLGGKNDVASVSRFAKNMENYTDDGKIFHGAYGHRWRQYMPAGPVYSHDQLSIICDALRKNPDDRRCVLQMWDALSDLGKSGKDLPCNVTATFQVDADGRLNICVFNRSNDIVWGAYGANAVHFSVLLEYVALRAGLKVGTYHQISVNWHGYLSTYLPLYELFQETDGQYAREDLEILLVAPCPYESGQVEPFPLMHEGTDPQLWDQSLQRLLRSKGHAPTEGSWADPFFIDVAIPLLRAHDVYKETKGDECYAKTLDELAQCRASDWRVACSEWVTRRWRKFEHDAGDGVIP